MPSHRFFHLIVPRVAYLNGAFHEQGAPIEFPIYESPYCRDPSKKAPVFLVKPYISMLDFSPHADLHVPLRGSGFLYW